jgi:hypothetical protein
MTLDDFRKSLTAANPPAELSPFRWPVVGCQGRLDANPLIGPVGRRHGRLVHRFPAIICTMLLPILLATSLLPSQQASMRCVDGGSVTAAVQTQPLRGPDGMVAVLKVSSADDHSKNSHLCNADYVLLITPANAGAAATVDLLTTDADWDRTLSLRLDGFSHDGKQVFGVLAERGKYPSDVLFDYGTTERKARLIDIRKQVAHVAAARCATTFDVVGTTEAGGIVVELDSENPCTARGCWVVSTDGSARRLLQGASVRSLFAPGASARKPGDP